MLPSNVQVYHDNKLSDEKKTVLIKEPAEQSQVLFCLRIRGQMCLNVDIHSQDFKNIHVLIIKEQYWAKIGVLCESVRIKYENIFWTSRFSASFCFLKKTQTHRFSKRKKNTFSRREKKEFMVLR